MTTGGRLLPDLLNEEERRELPEKMKMQKDICESCFPACTAPDPEDPEQRAFVADAIISNPVAYGHVHCAEALSVPLVTHPPKLPSTIANIYITLWLSIPSICIYDAWGSVYINPRWPG